ncbi:MAG TPA: alkaline phosphatase family protein [Solirubrobacterales bacterium]|nr:alkaline phosphatase family protein [Solirubrobacterales bacterium]
MTLVVVDAVGLTPRALEFMPRMRRLADDGFQARLDPVLPAVTCSVQSTLLTGLNPSEHGIVGNGWYFRDLGEVLLWRQHNALVEAEKVWETARRVNGGFRVANLCWWYAMGASTDFTVTPRPIYHADGRKTPDCYTDPPQLHDRFDRRLGEFPLFNYWGPGAGIESSRWIADAARLMLDCERLDMLLVYLPHLDYDLQRFGPDSPEAIAAARDLDEVAGRLVEYARARGDKVVVLSEYGITPANRTVDINRALRRAGLLRVYEQAGMEYLDPWTSRAFAVADHQIAHVYARDPRDLARAREALAGLPGIDELLEGEAKAAAGLDHPRSGDLVAVAERDAWFTYYYWLDDELAPDFARTVEIHRKPGYDPAELFIDPDDRWAKLRAGMALVRKRLGMRYLLDVVPLDPRHVRGTHGRMPEATEDAPVLICSDRSIARDRVAATEVRDLLLELQGLSVQGRMALA